MAKTTKDKYNTTITVLVIILIIIAVIGFLLFKKYKLDDRDKIGVEWGDNYFQILSNDLTNRVELKGATSTQVSFFEYNKEKTPIMFLETNDNKKLIYTINESKEIVLYSPLQNSKEARTIADIKYLYNVADAETKPYVQLANATSTQYIKLEDYMIVDQVNPDTYLKEHSVEIENNKMYYDEDGFKLSSYESLFIELEKAKIARVNVNLHDAYSIKLKAVSVAVNENYKTEEEIINNKEVKDELVSKAEKLKRNLEEIEAHKDAKAIAAGEVIKIGEYTLRFGTYMGEATATDGKVNRMEIEIKQENEFVKRTYTNNVADGFRSGNYTITPTGITIDGGIAFALVEDDTLETSLEDGTKYQLTYQGY